jgi:hypothetical protein
MSKVEECVYCGEHRELTSDHVPPRCLFSKPRPPLVTVPCCLHCNREFGKYDEYFRLAITTGIDRQAFPKENADSVRAINNLNRSESQGFARRMLKDYLPNPSRLKIDKENIEIVLWRITRGLFFHHRQVRMAGPIAFAFRMVDENLKINESGQQRIDRLAGSMTMIGSRVFRYSFEPFLESDPLGTAWLMRFYDHKTFFCVTASDNAKNFEGGVPES